MGERCANCGGIGEHFDGCLVGTCWRINDSKRPFIVTAVENRYAEVENLSGPLRRRRILAAALRTSNAKTGYTQIDMEAPDDRP